MSGIVCPSCDELVPLSSVFCPSCGARTGVEPRAPGDPHPFHDSMTPGRQRIRREAAYVLRRLNARRAAIVW